MRLFIVVFSLLLISGCLGIPESRHGQIPENGGLDRPGPGCHHLALPDHRRHGRGHRPAQGQAVHLLLDRPMP